MLRRVSVNLPLGVGIFRSPSFLLRFGRAYVSNLLLSVLALALSWRDSAASKLEEYCLKLRCHLWRGRSRLSGAHHPLLVTLPMSTFVQTTFVLCDMSTTLLPLRAPSVGTACPTP